MWTILFLVACTDKEAAPVDTQAPATRQTLSGSPVWSFDFDAEAEAAGQTDCGYPRTYTGVEDRSAPWICPSCELLFYASTEVERGPGTCFSMVNSGRIPDIEWIGYQDGAWYRSVDANFSERGPASYADGVLTISQTYAGADALRGGTYDLSIDGELSVGEEEGSTLPYAAASSYSCGWPKADPPPYTGDYTLVEGQPLPDGLFQDECGDWVRLHDFAGNFLLIETGTLDCSACQQFAEGEAQFLADMEALGIPVTVVTLMSESLDVPASSVSASDLIAWREHFGLDSAVLSDRLWALSVVAPAVGSSYGNPSLVLADPELNVVQFGTGFPGFNYIKSAIRQAANP